MHPRCPELREERRAPRLRLPLIKLRETDLRWRCEADPSQVARMRRERHRELERNLRESARPGRNRAPIHSKRWRRRPAWDLSSNECRRLLLARALSQKEAPSAYPIADRLRYQARLAPA